MDMTAIRQALGPAHPGYRARQIYEAVYRGMAADLAAGESALARCQT